MSTTPSQIESPLPTSNTWIRAVSPEGEGWTLEADAKRAGWRFEEIDSKTAAWRTDLWLRFKMDLAIEQGILKGKDLNLLQQAVLVAAQTLRGETEAAKREAAMLDTMFVTNQQMYQAYMASKKQETVATIKWIAPKTVEELFEAAEKIGEVLKADGQWEVAYSEYGDTLNSVDSPFDADDLKKMVD